MGYRSIRSKKERGAQRSRSVTEVRMQRRGWGQEMQEIICKMREGWTRTWRMSTSSRGDKGGTEPQGPVAFGGRRLEPTNFSLSGFVMCFKGPFMTLVSSKVLEPLLQKDAVIIRLNMECWVPPLVSDLESLASGMTIWFLTNSQGLLQLLLRQARLGEVLLSH